MIKLKRILLFSLCSILLTLSVNFSYVKAGVAVPIGWSFAEVVGTLLEMVGVSVVAETLFEYEEKVSDLADNFVDYVGHGYDVTTEKAGEIIQGFVDLMDGAQVTGRLQGIEADLMDALKSWASGIFASKNLVELPTGYEKFFAITGWEVGATGNNELSSIATIMAYNNIVVARQSSTSVYIYILDIDTENVLNVLCRDGNFIYRFDKSTGTQMDSAGIQYRPYTNYGTSVGSVTTKVTDFMVVTILYIASGVSIYASYADYIACNPPISLVNEDEYPDVTTVAGVNKLWEKYGNLDNLDVVAGGQSIGRDGVISVDVPDTKTREGIIDGTIALDDVIPYTLVDTEENVIIDNAYVDDAVPDTPYEEIDYGDNEPYIMTGDLTTLFPFCIPFDLIRLFKVFKADAKVPYWEVPIKSETFNIDYAFVIDFSQFESLVQILRILETIGFILGLILATRALIKG